MTTVKQALWDLRKMELRALNGPRGVAVTVAEVRKCLPCVCVHARKHHRKGGGCRTGCDCQAGIR